MKLSKVDRVIIVVFVAAYILIACGLAAIVHGTEDDDPFEYVNAYITVEKPETGIYTEGDIVRMTAHIEVIRKEYATPTDLAERGSWWIKWQRNDADHNEPDFENHWYDVGNGWEYCFAIDRESAKAWFRFVATWRIGE